MIKKIKINDTPREELVIGSEKVRIFIRMGITSKIMFDNNNNQSYALKSIVEKELGSVKYD